MQAMFQKLVEENARLWAEKQMTGFGGQHPANAPGGPGYGPCQPMSSMMALASAGQPTSSTMGSLWEKMKTTVHHPPDGGLLRGLTPPPSPAPVQGGLSRVVQEVKTNLLDVFNGASTEVKNEPAAMSSQQHPGGEQRHGMGHQAGGHGGHGRDPPDQPLPSNVVGQNGGGDPPMQQGQGGPSNGGHLGGDHPGGGHPGGGPPSGPPGGH